MGKIARVFAMEWSTALQYRMDTILWTLSEAATPLISLAVWYTVAQTTSFALSPKETFTYYVLIIFIGICTNAWNGFFFARQILSGELAQYLVRPLSVFIRHGVNNVIEKSIKLLIPIPLFIAATLIFSEYFSPAIYEPRHIALCIVSVILGAFIAFFLEMVFGSIAFWFEDANEIRRYKDLLHEVTSGMLIPFAALPPVALALFSWLPFRYIVSLPIEILLGQVEGYRALQLLGVQGLWLIGLVGLQLVLWNQGLKRYAVPAQ